MFEGIREITEEEYWMYEVKLDDGKYTLINDNGQLSCLRYGEVWRESIHDNVMLALIHAYEELEEKLRVGRG